MDYDYRSTRLTVPEPHTDPMFRAWLSAVRRGFHQDRITPTRLAGEGRIGLEEGWVLRGVHATGSPADAISDDEPVATFCEWTGELSLGEGRTVPLLQISDVTVRPTHRRQGFLRRLMTESLTEAHAAGVPVAGLTVTEATIYGRFGFGPATSRHAIEVDAGPRFDLRSGASEGRVEFLTMDGLARVADEVFGRFHAAQAGSVGRVPARRDVLTGALDEDTFEPSAKVRAAAHWDAAGNPDGYLTWVYDGDFTNQRIKIVDLVATTERAELALWEFVCSIDLVSSVRWGRAAADDPLPWAMSDRRGYTVTGIRDMLWLRVLDPAAVFGARPYLRDGSCRFRVVDPMGFADGAWELRIAQGTGTLTPAHTAETEVDVQALGAILLGGVQLGSLAAAGLLRGSDDEIDRLNALVQTRRSPRCHTPF